MARKKRRTTKKSGVSKIKTFKKFRKKWLSFF